MTGIALLLSGEAADNAAYAYSGTVASGTVNCNVYTGCGRYELSNPLLTGQAIIEVT